MFKAQSKDRSYITHLLAKCFDDNISVNYIVPQDRHRSKRLLRLMEYSFDYCQLHGNIFLSDDRQGCALVVYPHKTKPSLRSTLLDLRLITTCVGLANLKKTLQREALLKKLYPREPFCYLWFIGVSPTAQHNGIGSALLRELLGQCDSEALPVYLETSVERNVPWYERLGFIEYKTLNPGYLLHCMKRGARLYAD